MSPAPTSPRTAVAAAACLLLVVHGLGRFIYTPLLPLLVEDGLLSVTQAADLASWNYLGYLLGALVAIRWHTPQQLRVAIPAALTLHCLSMLGLTQTSYFGGLLALRLANGLSNGMIFVMVPALLMEWLAARQRIALSGLAYLGVGGGLIISGLLANPPSLDLHAAQRWWPAALLSLPLAVWGAWVLARLDNRTTLQHSAPPRRLLDRHSAPLFLAYAGAGLGYILPMTFLPMIASLQLGSEHPLVSQSWLILACATLPSAWVWNRLGQQLGDRTALIANYAMQAVSVFAALLLPPALGLPLCALLMGSSFLGAVLLTQRLGRTLQPDQGPRLSAALIALYGLTQLLAPWLARVWLEQGGQLPDTLWLGAAALVWSLGWMLAVPPAKPAEQ
ncbi:MAG: YbfB/YjiJ family MFS transporter [Halopseudomonas sp.]|uniref:YbfB/YjiJ family MFS transporter n=1 Tax=Halopseudomonas sp. TaxID=2901191 RepID=UPI003001BFC5